MTIALAIFSVVIISLSLYGVLLPKSLTEMVLGIMSRQAGLWIAVAVRFFLAVMLWISAPVSHTPAIFKVLAALMLLSAVAIPIVGLARLKKLIEHISSWPQWLIRVGCLFGVGFGGFLLWSISSAIGSA